jgi:hypothetical protein
MTGTTIVRQNPSSHRPIVHQARTRLSGESTELKKNHKIDKKKIKSPTKPGRYSTLISTKTETQKR